MIEYIWTGFYEKNDINFIKFYYKMQYETFLYIQ